MAMSGKPIAHRLVVRRSDRPRRGNFIIELMSERRYLSPRRKAHRGTTDVRDRNSAEAVIQCTYAKPRGPGFAIILI